MDAVGPSFNPGVTEESPDLMSMHLYDMLHAAEQELWHGSTHSQLSAISRMLSIKSKHNFSERCYDDIVGFIKEVLPEDNMMTVNFYETRS